MRRRVSVNNSQKSSTEAADGTAALPYSAPGRDGVPPPSALPVPPFSLNHILQKEKRSCGHCSLARARERRAASETLQGRSHMNSLARNQLSLPRHGRLSEAYCLGARGVTPRRCRDRAAAPARARSLWREASRHVDKHTHQPSSKISRRGAEAQRFGERPRYGKCSEKTIVQENTQKS